MYPHALANPIAGAGSHVRKFTPSKPVIAMPTFPSGDFAIGDDRRDPGAESRRHLTAARPRPRREAIPVLHVDRSGVGPNEAARRYADRQAEGMATDGYTQARAIDLAAEREAVATDLGDHGCDRSTALHFAAIVVAGLVHRGKL